jgi:hypothetical protein
MKWVFPAMGVRLSWLILVTSTLLLAGCDRSADPSQPPVNEGSQLPNLSPDPSGGLIMSWVEPIEEGHRLQIARYADGRWGRAMTVARGEKWFVNWADFPSVRAIHGDLWAAHWLVRHGWSAYAYDVRVSVSHDAGRTWSEPVSPHADGTPTEHGFVSLFPLRNAIGLVWLDGRATLSNTSGDRVLGMMLRAGEIDRQGEITEMLLDELVCDCCQTDVAIGPEGPLLVYRDRSDQEIRDIVLARHDGERWLAGERVAADNWQVFGCPVNGPAIDAAGRFVAVAWYTQLERAARVQLALSADGGRSFSDPIVLDSQEPVGRVDVAVDESGTAIVSWVGGEQHGRSELRYRTVGQDGAAGEVDVVTWLPSSPPGFPRMARTRHGILFAWTEVRQGVTRVRTREIRLEP